LTIGGYVLFGLLAFGWRSLVHYRRTGSTGFRGLSGRPGSLEWLGGMLFVLAIVCGPLAPVLVLSGTLMPLSIPGSPFWRALGIAFYTLGLAGTLWAQATMGASWRIGVDASERTQLVIKGPFLYVRNPIFTCMVLAISGLALLVPNAMAAVAVAALLSGIEIHVRAVEEPYLMRTHGEAYRRYAAVVGRFVPGVGERKF